MSNFQKRTEKHGGGTAYIKESIKYSLTKCINNFWTDKTVEHLEVIGKNTRKLILCRSILSSEFHHKGKTSMVRKIWQHPAEPLLCRLLSLK